MKTFITTLTILLTLMGTAFALTADKTGTEVTIQYDEPTKNEDDSPLTDLDKTTIYYEDQSVDVPASAPTGGGHIVQVVTVASQPHTERDISFTATATDDSGNESVPSVPVIVRVDELAPAQIQ